MLLLGIDLGSSSVKVSVIEGDTGVTLSSASYPPTEMEIKALKPGWAEQDPGIWWSNLTVALRACLKPLGERKKSVGAIGIAYQMHGLVAVDKEGKVLRPSIIWCDSRAVETGNRAFEKMGKDFCLHHLLNSPGNFTASKLAWVRENEPALFKKIHKIMLPGDYIAMRFTGEIRTSYTGLSEGIFWDFKRGGISQELLDYYGIPADLLPEAVPSFSVQGTLSGSIAEEMGLQAGIPVSYRAGDQPNNALSLNVLSPGEVATTAGTSGVIYGVTGEMKFDPQSRINTFLHVNHNSFSPRLGVLLCINGTGILYSWLNKITGAGLTYKQMNEMSSAVSPGSEELFLLPFGNGAERMLRNSDISSSFHGLNFNIHTQAHLFRAAQEAIAYSFRYGLEIMKETGINPSVIRAGESNLFLSRVFRDTLASLTSTVITLYNTDGSAGAARGAGIGCGYYNNEKEAFRGLETIGVSEPDEKLSAIYETKYHEWVNILDDKLYN
ncbi:MAG: FGGY family carbohydrate kinase [Bacteroidales bacterium]|jgi:xylulokinase|nr:FGGY family carbohydrate kinase [Bacteroidales bacterium]